MSSLEDLRAAVTAAADSVTSLKASGGDPADIKAAVVSLLGAKKAFADANGGIGVDGKPFSDGKKDKKKKKEGAAPPPKLEANAENAAKKAAKKAEKAAKKAAAKAAAGGGAPPPSAPSADKPPPAPAAVATTIKAPAVKANAPAKKRKVAQFGKVEPLQVRELLLLYPLLYPLLLSLSLPLPFNSALTFSNKNPSPAPVPHLLTHSCASPPTMATRSPLSRSCAPR